MVIDNPYLVWMIHDEDPAPSRGRHGLHDPGAAHPVVRRAELRVLVGDHEALRDEVKMLRTLRNLQPLQVFVHAVLARQLVAAGEVVDSLVRQQGLEGLGLGMRTCPHEVEVHVVDPHLVEAVGVEDLADDLGVRLHHLEGEVVAGARGVGGGLAQALRAEDDDGVAPLLHGGPVRDVLRLVRRPGRGETDPGLVVADLSRGLVISFSLPLATATLHVLKVFNFNYKRLDVRWFLVLFELALVDAL